MRKTITLLAATTALAGGLAFPAFSAIRAGADDSMTAAVFSPDHDTPRLVLISGDEDESGGRAKGGDDDDEDDDCEEDDGGCNGAGNPAPASTVAPPDNGLFGTGAAPVVRTN